VQKAVILGLALSLSDSCGHAVEGRFYGFFGE